MDNDNHKKAQEWRKFGIALTSTWIIASSIIISVLIGFGLDWLFHTKRVFVIIMFLVGIIAGMYNLIKELKKLE